MTSVRYKLVLQKFYKTTLGLQRMLFDIFYSVLSYTISFCFKNYGSVPLYQPLDLLVDHSQPQFLKILHSPREGLAGLQNLQNLSLLFWTTPN